LRCFTLLAAHHPPPPKIPSAYWLEDLSLPQHGPTLLSKLAHPKESSETTTHSQPTTTAAAVNGPERSPSALFATTINGGIFAKGKIHTSPHSSQAKT
jgi:hypothetical protein